MTSNSYKILLPIETTSRELLYKLVLGVKFAKQGFQSFVGAKEDIYRLFGQISPFVFFDKGYHAGISDKLYNLLNNYDSLLVSLDEEGGVDFKDMSTILARYPEHFFEKADLIFIWGRAQYDFLKANRLNFCKSHTVVSGHPRFELLKPQYHSLYEQQVSEIKREFGRYVLFCTNMGFGNNIRGNDFVRSNYGSRIRDLGKIIAFDKEKVKSYISLIMRLSAKLDCKVIIRPHPEEDHDTYRKAFSAFSKVKIIFRGAVIPWILGAEVMVHPDCTTGIESCMMEKLPLSYLPRFDETLCPFVPVKVSRCFTSEDEIVKFIVEGKYADMAVRERHQLMQEYFSINKGSIDCIVKEVCSLVKKNKLSNFRDISISAQAIGNTRKCLGKALSHMRSVFANSGHALMQNKRAGLDVANFSLMFNSTRKCLGVDESVSMDCVWPGLYRIVCRKS
ncbi:MAG: surface carbohydrate biosynthesis protein [bacterium]